MAITACEEGCTSHSDEVHNAIQTLKAYGSVQGHWTTASNWGQEHSAWTLVPAVPPEPGTLSWPIEVPGQGLGRMPAPQVMQNEELLAVFVNFLSQFTASLDGKPDASNPYIKYYVPYCINSQLLAHVAIYSAACFLTDTGHVERTVAMAHKGHVIKLLNEHIRSQLSPSDEVIAGVLQITLDEWLWGNINDLRAHLRGLRDMIKSRGGFRTLGLNGLISKLAISADIAIALSFEALPFLRGSPEFEFRDSSQIPLRLALNTPLIPTLVRFSSCASALHIHPAVASILDDMRFLLAAVLALPAKPSAKELQKVHTTSAWIHERISGLPEHSPTTRRPSAASSTPSRGSSTIPEACEDPQLPPSRRGQPQTERQHSQKPRRSPTQERSPDINTPSPLFPPTVDADSPSPDHVYQAVRLAALLYSRGIMHRRPFSLVVTSDEFLRLWTTAWRVPLSTWRSLLGVFNWVLLPIVSSGKAAQPHDRFVKGMMNISLFQMGMDNWELASSVMEAELSLQRWLGGESVSSSEMGGDAGEGTKRGQWREEGGSPREGMGTNGGGGFGSRMIFGREETST
ncbi:hypothetical protein CHGG_00496 [Chaetomium globosum CBS 148.51]|jgi:hypothetical protein|uniref:Transcription factor domain-containing protein n=1 Tax=Chaetomium globosum (strain ATCC 6205 / CBS 148.51 / DSM 1962 / NBRC 6347 / NRRL 1970) TaxID=306901 RepID=Q2HH08_CHAGB|nr:uncharacterized protein CHGG_00496 [Chaetomium globosum CBS 148.51]EAQ92261.1 hypothetical protein CHGG_00496 [Chaetomium globosum CBS 148.51]